MPFGVSGFGNSANRGFNGKYEKKFSKLTDFNPNKKKTDLPARFDFEPFDKEPASEIRFYNSDSLWSRWRRGYELYTLTQTYLGSGATERNTRGDFRMYCAFQQFPGVFIPARIFTFPSTDPEIGEHMVGVRDTNSFNFYNFGLPILAVRYLTVASAGTYAQSGTTITVTLSAHSLQPTDSVYLVFTSGSGVDATLPIASATQNTFTCTAAVAATTSGNVTVRESTTVDSPKWSELRVKFRFLPTPVEFFAGERLADRVVEKDPGVAFAYSQVLSTITVNCFALHGLATGNQVLLVFFSGASVPNLYTVTVTSPTQFTVQSIVPSTTSGTGLANRRIRGYDYNDYVGYTVTGTDDSTKELLFQRADSYGSKVIDGVPTSVVPAHRGFVVGRFLTTEIRHQCSCPDFMRRKAYNLYEDAQKRNFPTTTIKSVKPGQRLGRTTDADTGEETGDGFKIYDQRAQEGVYSDLGYVAVNNFYQLPTYEDSVAFSQPNLMYYQTRWCKHVYAAMWSIVHDEGNLGIKLTGKYTQAGGPNITIIATDHGLGVNTKMQLDFTSGNAISGEYTISEVVDKNTFLIIYPFTQTTAGYVTIKNLKNHEYVGAWLHEPNDMPIGAALEKFYERLDRDNKRTKKQAERMAMMGYGMPWTGAKEITGARNQPQQVGNFDANLVSLMMTDNMRRKFDTDPDSPTFGQNIFVHTGGVKENKATLMLMMMNKLFNIAPELIESTKVGMLDQPLTDYTSDFQFGEIDGGTYLNGIPVPVVANSDVNCQTYNPLVPQVIFIDAGSYINT